VAYNAELAVRAPGDAGLVEGAKNWRWGSLWRRRSGEAGLLHPGPLPEPSDRSEQVNRPQTDAKLEAVRRAAARGCHFGGPNWQVKAAVRHGVGYTLRSWGRPRGRNAAEGDERSLF